MKNKILTAISTIMLFVPWTILPLRTFDWALESPVAEIMISCYVLQARDEKVRELCISYLSNMMSLGFSKEEATNFLTEYSSKLKEPNKCNH